MASLQYITLIRGVASGTGYNTDATAGTSDLSETLIQNLVQHINRALEWAWMPENPALAWPFTITDDATITVTNGVIAWADLGAFSGGWFSLWTADPRPYGNSAVTIEASWDEDGVYPKTTETSIFGFYRSTLPQGTYASGGTYTTPTYPQELKEMVTQKALAYYFEASDAEKRAARADERAQMEMDRRLLPLLNSPVPWLMSTGLN